MITVLVVGCLVGLTLQSQNALNRGYSKTDFWANVELGNELYATLDPKFQRDVHTIPVALETNFMPYLRSVEEKYQGEPKPLRMVFISGGFIDLMNRLAHAKAINKRGYFKNYVEQLGKESGDYKLQPLPDISNQKYWSDKVMNRQLSNFHQMIGILVGIELSHLYLGHYDKYASRLNKIDGIPGPINGLLTNKEWENALTHGVKHALDLGYGTEGVKALYDAIDQLDQRPRWTEYFIPKSVKVRKLKRELKKLENDFFLGK